MTLRHVDLRTLSAHERESGEDRVVRIHLVWQESGPDGRPDPLLHRLALRLRHATKQVVLRLWNARLNQFHTICKQLSIISTLWHRASPSDSGSWPTGRRLTRIRPRSPIAPLGATVRTIPGLSLGRSDFSENHVVHPAVACRTVGSESEREPVRALVLERDSGSWSWSVRPFYLSVGTLRHHPKRTACPRPGGLTASASQRGSDDAGENQKDGPDNDVLDRFI